MLPGQIACIAAADGAAANKTDSHNDNLLIFPMLGVHALGDGHDVLNGHAVHGQQALIGGGLTELIPDTTR